MCISQLLTSLLSLLQVRYHLKCLRWLPRVAAMDGQQWGNTAGSRGVGGVSRGAGSDPRRLAL